MISLAYQNENYFNPNNYGCQTIIGTNNRKIATISYSLLNESVRKFVEDKAKICQPDRIHVCNGSDAENQQLINLMVKEGMLEKLPKYENWQV